MTVRVGSAPSPGVAFSWLERAYKQHDPDLVDVRFDPLLTSLRGDPRYEAFGT